MTMLSSAEDVGKMLFGFLTKHVEDLNAVSGALQGILAAVPVNAETRANIDSTIQRITTSADNIGASLEKVSGIVNPPPPAPKPVQIAESDIEKAVNTPGEKAEIDSEVDAEVRRVLASSYPTGETASPTVPTGQVTQPQTGA